MKPELFWFKVNTDRHCLQERKYGYPLTYGTVEKTGFSWTAYVPTAHAQAEFDSLREAKAFVDEQVRRRLHRARMP